MKNTDPKLKTKRIRSVARISCILVLSFFAAISLFAQIELYGPQQVPPKESSIVAPGTDSLIGRPGGKQYTFTNITLSNSTDVYWTMTADSIVLSMDGIDFVPSEILEFDAGESDLENGFAVWSGATFIPIDGSGPRALDSRFTITVTDQSSDPVALFEPDSIDLDANSGAVVSVTGSSMVFKVRMEMFVSDNAGATWTPHLNYFDAANTPPDAAGTAYSTYSYEFYWTNDPPEVETNLTLFVDEGDTSTISADRLSASDVESLPGEMMFIFDPLAEGLLPQNGSLLLNDELMASGDTFTMADILAGNIEYVHDGSETLSDLLPLMLIDGDGDTCLIAGEPVFTLSIQITPADDDPTVVTNTGMDTDEGSMLPFGTSILLTTDPESGAVDVTYTLDPMGDSDYPMHGLLLLSGVPLSDGGTFTQSDVDLGLLQYQHDGSENYLDGFVFNVMDEYGHLAANGSSTIFFSEIRIANINDDPVLTMNQPLQVSYHGSGIVTSSMLAASDAESDPEDIVFTLNPDDSEGIPSEGVFKLDGTELGAMGTFTMEDILNNLVSYQHTGASGGSDFVTFTAADGEGALASDAGFTVFHFNVTIDDPSALQMNTSDGKDLFSAYPNPAVDKVSISFTEELAGEVSICLLNILGESIWENKQDVSENCVVPTDGLSEGIYFLRIETELGAQVEQISKK
jgi:hypothetical protein